MAHFNYRNLTKVIFLDSQRLFLVKYITIYLREVEEDLFLGQLAVGPE
jgi:hypothetical protein